MKGTKGFTLLAVCLATFMLLVDITVVNVALPDIQKDLKSSFSDLQWVVDAYSLTLAALLLTFGSLADRIGRRKVFVAGLAVFTLASLLCGLATTPTFLNLARALQGVGGSIMFAVSLALLAAAFDGPDRGKAIGIWGATIGFAVAIGPLIGGVLTEGLGWEWIFFVNLPVGVGTILLALSKVEESRAPEHQSIDWAGVVTFSTALFLLIFGLIRANDAGWGSTEIVACFAGAAILLAIFVVIEYRRRDPMLDLELFRKPTFSGASIAAFCLSASMFALFLYLTLYMQNILEYSPLQAGLRFLPLSLVSFVVAPIVGNLTERMPVRIFFGLGLSLVGVGLLLMNGVSRFDDWTTLLAGFLVAGVGIGMTNPPIASTAVGVVAPARSGMASGINTTFRQVGIATGIAAFGAIFESRVTEEITPRVLSGDPDAFGQLIVSSGIRNVPPQFKDFATDAFIAGFNEILLIGAVVAFAGAVLSFLLVRSKDFVRAPGAEAAVPAA